MIVKRQGRAGACPRRFFCGRNMTKREENFEKMLAFVQEKYADTVAKMEDLKAADKTKSATFRQLMGDKLMYQNMLTLYKLYGLIEE